MKITKYLTPNPRPYWHVDAKWLCGIFLIFFLTLTLLISALVKITDEKHGPTIAALAIGSAFIRSDSTETTVDEARQEIRNRGGVIHPIPNFPSVTITEKDLELSTYDVKIKVFKPLTDIIYTEGVEATAERFATTKEQKEQFIKDAFIFRFFTKDTHASLKERLKITAIISVIFLLAVVYFSASWGRLANPGFLLLLTSLPGALLTLMLTHTPAPKDASDKGPLGFIPPDVAKELGESVGQGYTKLAILGVILFFAAGIGKLITTVKKKRSHKLKGSS